MIAYSKKDISSLLNRIAENCPELKEKSIEDEVIVFLKNCGFTDEVIITFNNRDIGATERKDGTVIIDLGPLRRPGIGENSEDILQELGLNKALSSLLKESFSTPEKFLEHLAKQGDFRPETLETAFRTFNEINNIDIEVSFQQNPDNSISVVYGSSPDEIITKLGSVPSLPPLPCYGATTKETEKRINDNTNTIKTLRLDEFAEFLFKNQQITRAAIDYNVENDYTHQNKPFPILISQLEHGLAVAMKTCNMQDMLSTFQAFLKANNLPNINTVRFGNTNAIMKGQDGFTLQLKMPTTAEEFQDLAHKLRNLAFKILEAQNPPYFTESALIIYSHLISCHNKLSIKDFEQLIRKITTRNGSDGKLALTCLSRTLHDRIEVNSKKSRSVERNQKLNQIISLIDKNLDERNPDLSKTKEAKEAKEGQETQGTSRSTEEEDLISILRKYRVPIPDDVKIVYTRQGCLDLFDKNNNTIYLSSSLKGMTTSQIEAVASIIINVYNTGQDNTNVPQGQSRFASFFGTR